MLPLRCLVPTLCVVSLLHSGCMAVKAVTTPVSLAGSAVVAAGTVATKSIKATGQVTGSAVAGAGRVAAAGLHSSSRVSAAVIDASGELTAGTIEMLSQFAVEGMVTFVDVSTGSVSRVPWRAGLTIYGGSALAEVQMAERAVAVVRSGRLIYHTGKALAAVGSLVVSPGDVIRLAAGVG